KNLYWKEKGKLAWRFNVPVLNRTIGDMVGQPVSGVSHVQSLFIRGGKSNYILEEDEALIKEYFPFATVFSIEDAGHWVHAEATETFFEITRSFLTAG
ncbi:MAG: alpha/beta hydrolase, partial [Bacteroidota bacterium]